MSENSIGFWEHALMLWQAGGWLMIPLALLGMLIYASVLELWLYLKRHNYYNRDENEWGHWVDQPDDAKGEIGAIIRYSQGVATTSDEVGLRFDELKHAHLPRAQQRILFAKILIGAAPLTGLLGTVMGMLGTFLGLSISTAGNTLDLVAGGISEALITTQTGLMLAIPAYVIIYSLQKQVSELELFFSRLQILTVLKIQRQNTKPKIAS